MHGGLFARSGHSVHVQRWGYGCMRSLTWHEHGGRRQLLHGGGVGLRAQRADAVVRRLTLSAQRLAGAADRALGQVCDRVVAGVRPKGHKNLRGNKQAGRGHRGRKYSALTPLKRVRKALACAAT